MKKKRQLKPPQGQGDACVVIAYVGIEVIDDVEFVRVRWTPDPRADTWEPADHLLRELGQVTDRRLRERLEAQPPESQESIRDILNIGTRIGNDGTKDGSTFYQVESLWTRYERAGVTVYRVHWYGFSHKNDTYETRDSLCSWIEPDVMKGFEDERVLEYQRNPAPVLPQPIHTANNSVLGGISMGYTRQRRYILTSFVDEIANLQDQLSLWARRHVRHLNEFTTNRVS
jgi:hypothetical protein